MSHMASKINPPARHPACGRHVGQLALLAFALDQLASYPFTEAIIAAG